MAAVAASIPPPAARPSSRWIIGRGVDLSLVIGSAGAGYLYLLLYTAVPRAHRAAVVVLVGGLRRHAHLRHRLAAPISIAKRARAIPGCCTAA